MLEVEEVETEEGEGEKTPFVPIKKSLYQLAAELENENMNPSIESYGGSNVF